MKRGRVACLPRVLLALACMVVALLAMARASARIAPLDTPSAPSRAADSRLGLSGKIVYYTYRLSLREPFPHRPRPRLAPPRARAPSLPAARRRDGVAREVTLCRLEAQLSLPLEMVAIASASGLTRPCGTAQLAAPSHAVQCLKSAAPAHQTMLRQPLAQRERADRES